MSTISSLPSNCRLQKVSKICNFGNSAKRRTITRLLFFVNLCHFLPSLCQVRFSRDFAFLGLKLWMLFSLLLLHFPQSVDKWHPGISQACISQSFFTLSTVLSLLLCHSLQVTLTHYLPFLLLIPFQLHPIFLSSLVRCHFHFLRSFPSRDLNLPRILTNVPVCNLCAIGLPPMMRPLIRKCCCETWQPSWGLGQWASLCSITVHYFYCVMLCL